MIPTFEEKVLEHKNGHYIVQDWMGAVTEISDKYDYTYIRNAIDFVTRRWDAERKLSRRSTDYFRQNDTGLVFERTEEDEEEAYYSPSRPWYQAAVASPGRMVWSEVYLFASSHKPGIDSALALRGKDGRTMVLGIGFELKQLSDYLGRLPVASEGRVFVMNGKSQVVASSHRGFQPPPSLNGGQKQAPMLGEFSDPLLDVAHKVIQNEPPAAEAFRSYRVAGASGSRYFVTLQNTGYAKWMLGTVIPEAVFLERTHANQKTLIVLLSLFALFSAAAAAYLGRRWIGQPVDALRRAAGRIEQGDFDTRLQLKQSAEFAQLGTAFNYMVASLKERERERDMFGRVVSPEVREKLLSGQLQLGGETCWVSVVFSDIRGFSTLSERMTPQEVVSLLNEYLAEMSEAIKPWGGYINNFIGDAIVVVFGAPVAHEEIEWRAVAAAMSMRERLNRLNQRRRERGEVEISSGIGISTGEAVAGQIGSFERLLYTVIGDAVNLAARLETMTKDFPGNPILMNAQTAEVLKGREGLRLVDRGPMPIRGRANPIEVYSLELPELPDSASLSD
ncbi:MAG: Adenylate cyclase 1 [Betaproteobacteria bacterium ADurb.Bin341]|nr:MAG: Adenylate cyclase 1 [Betaproteobacteria bacterium ADurb.Bin341]